MDDLILNGGWWVVDCFNLMVAGGRFVPGWWIVDGLIQDGLILDGGWFGPGWCLVNGV